MIERLMGPAIRMIGGALVVFVLLAGTAFAQPSNPSWPNPSLSEGVHQGGPLTIYSWDGASHRPWLKGAPISGCTTNITDTTAVEAIAAQGDNTAVYITSYSVQNSHATQGTWVQIVNGSNVWQCYAAAVGGGCNLSFAEPLAGAADTAWEIDNETTGANTRGCLSGFTVTLP